jgi:lipopolysaccharide/colanic/teichoic acid biosynthesis glycosyltransferase
MLTDPNRSPGRPPEAEPRRAGVGPGWARRTLDVVVSLGALLLLLPVLVIVGVIVRCTGSGSVLFRQVRIGQGNVPFVMYKFRTMRPGAGGPEVTPADDLRVTRVGRFLRTTGLDELPQLLNILRGDMTLVGPRPETPALARRYPRECAVVFDYRPGLTGPSQVRLRDKDVLPSGAASDLEDHYLHRFVPARTALDLEYLAAPSLRRTFGLLVETAAYLLRPVRRALHRLWRRVAGGRVARPRATVIDLRDHARLIDLGDPAAEPVPVIDLRDHAPDRNLR